MLYALDSIAEERHMKTVACKAQAAAHEDSSMAHSLGNRLSTMLQCKSSFQAFLETRIEGAE